MLRLWRVWWRPSGGDSLVHEVKGTVEHFLRLVRAGEGNPRGLQRSSWLEARGRRPWGAKRAKWQTWSPQGVCTLNELSSGWPQTSGHHCLCLGCQELLLVIMQSARQPCPHERCHADWLLLSLMWKRSWGGYVIIVTKNHCCSYPSVHKPLSLFLGSGNTPITVWGTHLNLIQNPQIRAKHGGKEHINVSLWLAGVTGAVHPACHLPKWCGSPWGLRGAHPGH